MSGPDKRTSDYIGDGVYVEDHGFQIRLWTERDGGVVHEIYLEPQAVQDLMAFVKRIWGSNER